MARRVFFFSVLFLFFLLFSHIHPLIPLDGDDWLYLSVSRHALPLWGYWNPTKVFPEILMPFCGEVAANVVYPITGDYIGAIALVSASLVAAFITGCIYLLYRLLVSKWNVSEREGIGISLFVIILHFLVFRNSLEGNDWLFYCTDLTCYFNYQIPTLLNISLVLYLMRTGSLNQVLKGNDNYVKKGFLLLALYFACFSNLFSSIVLSAYLSFGLVKGVSQNIRNTDIKIIIKNNLSEILFLFIWIVAHVFELSGGRAEDLNNRTTFASQLQITMEELLNKTTYLNHTFEFILLGSVCFLIWKGLKEKSFKNLQSALNYLIMGGIALFYLIILSANAIPHYIWRPEVLLGFFFFVFTYIAKTTMLFIGDYRRSLMLLPVFLIILIAESSYASDTHRRTFRDCFGLTPLEARYLSDNLVEQYIRADFSLDSTIKIRIPKLHESKSCPINQTSIELMGKTLYKHGVISYYPENVEILKSDNKQSQFVN